jgi:hypothetical protein
MSESVPPANDLSALTHSLADVIRDAAGARAALVSISLVAELGRATKAMESRVAGWRAALAEVGAKLEAGRLPATLERAYRHLRQLLDSSLTDQDLFQYLRNRRNWKPGDHDELTGGQIVAMVEDDVRLVAEDRPRDLAACAHCCLDELQHLYDRWLREPDPAHRPDLTPVQRAAVGEDADQYRQMAIKALEVLAVRLAPALSRNRLMEFGWAGFIAKDCPPVARFGVTAPSEVEWACRFAAKVLATVEALVDRPGLLLDENFRRRPRATAADTLTAEQRSRLKEQWPRWQPALLELVAGAGCDWQKWQVKARWEFAQLVHREEAAVASPAAQPEARRDPAPESDWEFKLDGFRYKTMWHDLSGQKLRLLKAFVDAEDMTLSHRRIDEVCGDNLTLRAYTYVCELNKALRKLLELDKRPVRPIRGRHPGGEKYYRLHPPA